MTVLLVLLPCALNACLPKPAPEALPLGSEWQPALDPGRMAYLPRAMSNPNAALQALADIAPRLRLPGRSESVVEPRMTGKDLLVVETAWNEYEWFTPTYKRWPRFGFDPFCNPFCEEPAGPPQRRTLRRTETHVLPLQQVNDIRLYQSSSENDRAAQWLVRVVHEQSRTTELSAVDQEGQTLLADALYTLARAYGYSQPRAPAPQFATLTAAQADSLDIPGGALVLSWPISADMEGMQPAWPDVVLTVDGVPATAALLAEYMPKGIAEGRPMHLELLRWGLYAGHPRVRSQRFTLELHPYPH